MSMNLLFLTNRYPYGTGEAFIETEIHYLSNAFDKVLLLPIDADRTGDIRPLPSNVRIIKDVVHGPEDKNLLNRIRWALSMWGGVYGDVSFSSNKGRFSSKGLRRSLHNAVMAGRIKEMVTRLIEEEKVDLVYSYWSNYGAAGAVGAVRDKRNRITLICKVYGYDLSWERQDPPFVVFQNYLIKNLDKYLPDSKNGEMYLREKYPEYQSKISVRYLGTRSQGPSKMSNDRTFRILSCSSLIPLKRVHLIPESLKGINGRVEWTHFGDGPESKRIEAAASELIREKKDASISLKGNVSNSEIIYFYKEKRIDLFLHVSEYEGLPVSIMEAMSFGVPVVAADSGGIRELIGKNTGCGYLLPHDPTLNDIKNALTYFMNLSLDDLKEERLKTLKVWDKYTNADRNYSNFTEELKGMALRDKPRRYTNLS